MSRRSRTIACCSVAWPGRKHIHGRPNPRRRSPPPVPRCARASSAVVPCSPYWWPRRMVGEESRARPYYSRRTLPRRHSSPRQRHGRRSSRYLRSCEFPPARRLSSPRRWYLSESARPSSRPTKAFQPQGFRSLNGSSNPDYYWGLCDGKKGVARWIRSERLPRG